MLKTRSYGSSGPQLIVLHGGPAVYGYMAPVARGLADGFRVLEPLQRASGGEPLTVARHVADLHASIAARCDSPPALLGSSWGAMLALACAAAHPRAVGSLVLVGCGTFDAASRERMQSILRQRTNAALREKLAGLEHEIPDPDRRLQRMGELILPLYAHDLLTDDLEVERVDAAAHHETWDDMLRLQEEGFYPRAFAAITSPVLMLHGTADPHPGTMIRESLAPHLSHLKYHEWQRCGHYPWLERAVSGEFFQRVRRWLLKQCE